MELDQDAVGRVGQADFSHGGEALLHQDGGDLLVDVELSREKLDELAHFRFALLLGVRGRIAGILGQRLRRLAAVAVQGDGLEPEAPAVLEGALHAALTTDGDGFGELKVRTPEFDGSIDGIAATIRATVSRQSKRLPL